jgi:hypothetical protein
LSPAPDHRFLQLRVAVVELQCVGPAVEVRIPAIGEHQRPVFSLRAAVVLRCARQIRLGAVNKIIRVLVDPWVIRRHVIRHKVEQQLNSPLLQPLSQLCERWSATEIFMHRVIADRKAGTGDVLLA